MRDTLIELLQRLGELTVGSGLLLALIQVAGCLLFIPRSVLWMSSGFIFGFSAIPIIVPSTTIWSVAGFLTARYFFAKKLEDVVRRRPAWNAVFHALDTEGWLVLALLRLSSPVPGTVQDCLFGLTRIGLWPFTAITFAFSSPAVCLWVYVGLAGRNVLLEGSSAGLGHIWTAFGILVAMVVVWLIARRAQSVLERKA